MTDYLIPVYSQFKWQTPVLDKDLTSPPGGESKGDRYLIYGMGSGDWTGHDGDIAYYDGVDWQFITKKEGMVIYVKDEDKYYVYYTSWEVTDLKDLITKKHTQGTDTKIINAGGDTKVDVEESVGEKIIRMDVNSVEAFKLNADGILDLAKQSGYYVIRSGSQEVPTSTTTKIEFNYESYDNQNEFDSITEYRFTAKKAGVYLIIFQIYWAAPVDQGDFRQMIYRNGSLEQEKKTRPSGTSDVMYHMAANISLAANDYLDARVHQTSGVTKWPGQYNTFMSIHKLS